MKNLERLQIIFWLLICLTLASGGKFVYDTVTRDNAQHTASINADPNSAADLSQPGDLNTLPTAIADSPAETPPPVPAPAPTTSTYTVKSGDTLWDIASAYHITVDQLQALNNLNGDALSLGQTLTVTGQADKPVKIAERPASAPAPSRSGQTSRSSSVLQYAAQFLNTPYKYGGTSPSGFDCSGFTQYVYKHFGVSLPRTAASQASAGTRVDKANLIPGDLVFFATEGSGISHVGIYAGSGRFIHSSSPTSGGVIYTSLSESFYSRTYAGARRVSN